MRSKPSDYPALPFHGIRFLSFLSSLIVAIILAVFIYHLHADGYKLPFAFLILLIVSLLSLLNVIFTSLINCACSLNTKLSIILNFLIFLLWALGLALLSYNMAHTILTSCTTEYWGNSTGENVCRMYKVLFTFTILATASNIALLALDGIVRRRQNRLGAYGLAGPAEDHMELKLAGERDAASGYEAVPPVMTGGYRHQNTSYAHTLEQSHAGEAAEYYDAAPGMSRRGQTGYDPIMHR
ncbi:hypothetical protein N7494_012179 [Penicillium frequentans]|uniref:MARVEL domain-containing protein n=1 Tax=Penicillium frequentans TaxID=3151616 RepID=A0AAD6GBD8_9EURO|nr:hypothetical protein N7494_012179 [Penicillium glabrum]